MGTGQLSSAVDLMTEAVAQRPEIPEGWHKLGAALYFMADNQRACEAFERAASLDDSHYGYINDLGGIYLSMGRFDDAELAFRKALALEATSVEARYNLATCLSEQGKFLDAIPLLQSVISEKPELDEAKFNLGLVLRKMGKPEQAIPWLRQVSSEELPMAQLELARCYRDLANWAKAKEAYAIINSNLMNEIVAAEFAETIYLNGDVKEAIEYLQNTSTRYRQSAQRLQLLLADIYLNSGELEKATELTERLVSEEDFDGDYFLGAMSLLVRMQSVTGINESLENKLLRRLRLSTSDLAESVELHFTMAKFYDNAQRFSEAEKYYIEANALKKRRISYDSAQQESLVDSIIEFFSRDGVGRLKSDSNLKAKKKSIQPIFVVGLPRSGTTLIEQILAAHHSISSAGELGFFSNTASNMNAMFELEDTYPNSLDALSIDQLLTLKNTYLELLERHNTSGQYVTDKMPENFLHLGFIRLLFPEAKIIHVNREPSDIAISIFNKNFEQGNRYAFSLEDIAHYFVHYERLMAFWYSLEDPDLFQVRYEDIVREPEKFSKKLFSFLQLSWEAETLEYYRNKTDVRTASNWQVRQPLYRSSIGRSSNYPNMKAIFDKALSAQRGGLVRK